MGTRPATARTRQEPEGTTYADRVRRRFAAPPPLPVTAEDDDPGASDATDPGPRQLVAELMGPLAGRVRGAGTLVDYINLLTSLIFLRTCTPEQWHNLSRSTPPAKSPKEAERLLARIGEAADTALRRTGISPGMKSSLSRLQPEYEDLAHIIRLSEGLDRSAIRPLLECAVRHHPPSAAPSRTLRHACWQE